MQRLLRIIRAVTIDKDADLPYQGSVAIEVVRPSAIIYMR